jgi:molecular chaperone GrpE (heat shock protein)
LRGFDFKDRIVTKDANETVIENQNLKDENNNFRNALDELQEKYNKVFQDIDTFKNEATRLMVNKFNRRKLIRRLGIMKLV